MTRKQLVTHIKKRLSFEKLIDVDEQIINAILDIEEDEIYAMIAQNDSYRYVWGLIGGISKAPEKLYGKLSQSSAALKNHGYSVWKQGYPRVKWSKAARVYEARTVEDYYEQSFIRYTTEAREFRKECNLPEIPEYENLEEEKIVKLCAKADVEFKKYKKKHKTPLDIQPDNKKGNNDLKVKGRHIIWEQTGYVPYGNTKGWMGESRDRIDRYFSRLCKYDKFGKVSILDRLNTLYNIMDCKEYYGIEKPHLELYEKEKEYLKEIEKKGLKPLEHINKYTGMVPPKKEFAEIDYQGDSDAWGLDDFRIEALAKIAPSKELYGGDNIIFDELLANMDEPFTEEELQLLKKN